MAQGIITAVFIISLKIHVYEKSPPAVKGQKHRFQIELRVLHQVLK